LFHEIRAKQLLFGLALHISVFMYWVHHHQTKI
jgi:hypothetical protein